MEIDIFAICDFAQDVSGKLTIVGTFDTIFAPALPAIHPVCSIAASIRFRNNEAGQHSFRISIVDGSDKEIVPFISGNLKVQIPPDGEWGTAHIVVGIGQLKLPYCGKYSVNLLLDDKQIKSLPFIVKKAS
jgi:hypothetical protein